MVAISRSSGQMKTDKSQIWTMPTGGGEASKLTNVDGGITDIAWSPDSGALAFVSDVDPDRTPDDHDPKKDPRVSVVKRIRYRADGLGWRGRSVQARIRGSS